MASDRSYLDFILEQLSELEEISWRPMMGEYILYYRGKVFGGIYDNRLLVKDVPAALKRMPSSVTDLPYDGAKAMRLVSDADDSRLLCNMVRDMWNELPDRKKK